MFGWFTKASLAAKIGIATVVVTVASAGIVAPIAISMNSTTLTYRGDKAKEVSEKSTHTKQKTSVTATPETAKAEEGPSGALETDAKTNASQAPEIETQQEQPQGRSQQEELEYCNSLPQLPDAYGDWPNHPELSIDVDTEKVDDLNRLGCQIAQAHGYWGNQYSVGLVMVGAPTSLLNYLSPQIDRQKVLDILANMGALR